MLFITAINNQIPIRLYIRHIRHILKYSSIRKVWNAIKMLWHYFNEDTILSTKPLLLKVELSRHCTVNCRYCFAPKEYCFYSFEKFKTIVDSLAPYIFMTQLYEIGEPLHHPDILKCINYTHNMGIGTVISTSLSLDKPDSFWMGLVDSGLDRLIVAIDGITVPIYNNYRTNGNLSLVINNLKKILKFRKKGQNKLYVEWQMIDFTWNRCEHNLARKMAIALGCDCFRIIPDVHEQRNISKGGKKLRNKNCIWSFVLLLVNVKGDIVSCFKPDYNPVVLGCLSKSKLDEIWNGNNIRQIRSRKTITSYNCCKFCDE